MLVGMTILRALTVVAVTVIMALCTAKIMETMIRIFVACAGGQVGDQECQCPWAWLASICTMVSKRSGLGQTSALIR